VVPSQELGQYTDAEWEEWKNQLEQDEKYAMEISAWEENAVDGAPTSARAPQTTPPCKLLPPGLDFPTPEGKPVHPYRKTQLAAAKRLERELKSADKTGKSKTPPGTTQVTKDQKPPKKTKSAKKEEKKRGKDKKKNKGGAGPMAEAMQAFREAAQQRGDSYKEAMAKWKVSAERQAIVNGMSYAEQKRRRYC